MFVLGMLFTCLLFFRITQCCCISQSVSQVSQLKPMMNSWEYSVSQYQYPSEKQLQQKPDPSRGFGCTMHRYQLLVAPLVVATYDNLRLSNTNWFMHAFIKSFSDLC